MYESIETSSVSIDSITPWGSTAYPSNYKGKWGGRGGVPGGGILMVYPLPGGPKVNTPITNSRGKCLVNALSRWCPLKLGGGGLGGVAEQCGNRVCMREHSVVTVSVWVSVSVSTSYPPQAIENNYSYRKYFIERSITEFTPKRRKISWSLKEEIEGRRIWGGPPTVGNFSILQQ